MKRVLLIFFILLAVYVKPAFSADESTKLPNIFIYSIPDDIKQKPEVTDDVDAPMDAYINEQPVYNTSMPIDGSVVDSVDLSLDDEPDEVLNVTTLKGYAEFVEDVDSIYLLDDKNQFVLNLKVPQKITTKRSLDLQKMAESSRQQSISKYMKEEHFVGEQKYQAVSKNGDFSLGTSYGSEIDSISMLENSASMFTKYQKDKFALSSSFKKTMNTTIGTYSDVIYLTPEYKFNNIFSIKEVLSADLTKSRRSSELVFSVSPYGNRGSDRLLLEVGAKQTIDQNNELYRTQFNFRTIFKL